MLSVKRWLARALASEPDPRAQAPAAEDPEERRRLVLRRLREARDAMASVRMRMADQATELDRASERLWTQAGQALVSGDEAGVQAHLRERGRLSQQADHLRGQMAVAEAEERRLQRLVIHAQSQLASVAAQQELLAAQHNAVDAQVDLGDVLRKIQDDLANLGVALDQQQEHAEWAEGRVDVLGDLYHPGSGQLVSDSGPLDEAELTDQTERLRAAFARTTLTPPSVSTPVEHGHPRAAER